MNKSDPEQDSKGGLFRSLVTLGFIIVLLFGAWGGVQAVKFLPGAVSAVWNNISGNLSAAVIQLSSTFIPASASDSDKINNDSNIILDEGSLVVANTNYLVGHGLLYSDTSILSDITGLT